MPDEWTLKLTRDEGVVLFDYLTRWQETGDPAFRDEAERMARDNLLALWRPPTMEPPSPPTMRSRSRPPEIGYDLGVAASPGPVFGNDA